MGLLPWEGLLAAPLQSGLLALAALIVLSAVVNVAAQLLLPRDPSLPPMVFHFWPWLGSSVTYGMDPYAFFETNRRKYGNVFTFILAGRRVVVALTPAGSDLILNGKLAHVSAEDAYTNFTTPVFGTEVVYDCPNHLLMQQKKFMKFGLSTDNFKRYVGIIVAEVKKHISEDILAKGKAQVPKDAVDVGSEITICTAAATLQGKEVRSALDKTFADLYHDLDGGFTPINFVFPQLPLPSYWKRDRAHVRMRHFYLDIIERRRKNGGPAADDVDMMASLTGQEYKDGTPVSDKQVAHMMIALLMAGQHTSAATSSWSMLHIGADQQLQQDLYDEQVKVYGNPDGSLRPLNYEELQTPLLKSFIREVLRLHPPIHSIMRYVRQDMPVPPALADGKSYVVPKGHFLLAAPGVSQIDSSYWERPHSFEPRRWFGDIGAITHEDEAENMEDFGFGKISTGANSPYLPFGAGRHRCIGEQFAYVQLATIIATLVRELQWTLDSPFPVNDYSTMLLMPKKPRQLTFRPRAGRA